MSWAMFGRFELEMAHAQALFASQPGKPADAAVAFLLKDPRIAAQLDVIGPEKIRDELREYGAWDEKELADAAQNRARIVWIAAGDIREEE